MIRWRRREVLPLGCASVGRILGQDDRDEALWLKKMAQSKSLPQKYNKQQQPQRSWRLGGEKSICESGIWR
jgi:hypothetical protein